MKRHSEGKGTNNLLHILREADLSAYRPVVFWSINSSLEKEELVRQIGEMKSYNLGGFVFHARAGLTTEYLSEDWFSAVRLCLDEAKKQGMGVWMYDEFGWPSGFAGGRLLENPAWRAGYLEYKVLDSYDPDAYAVYDVRDGAVRLLRQGESAPRYHTLYARRSDAYVDILDPEVTDAFLRSTYEPYYARFSERFGKEFLGFFTDEPQYYRYATPLPNVAAAEYEKEYGTPLKEELLYLFLDGEKGYPFRVRYYNLLSRLYCENYYRKLYDWCEAHGCMLTGHSVEETFFFTQMWGGADCAPSYLYEHIPGMDNLTRSSPACISAKNVASVAAQTGRPHVLTETFGCSGYAATPRELRLAADRQYVHGVNTMVQHLYNYSLAGQGKTDHPISFGRTLPWVTGYAEFNDYFTRLGWLLGNSREEAPVAVLTPMESVYLDYKRLDEDAARNNVDVGFLGILERLRTQGVAYHFVNEKVLQKLGEVREGKLCAGKCAYSAVVLANCRELKSSTVRLLRSFLAAGGMLVTEGSAPAYEEGVPADLSDLRGNAGAAQLPRPACIAGAGVDYTVRTLENGKRFVFAVNEKDIADGIAFRSDFSLVEPERDRGFAPAHVHILPPRSSALFEEEGNYAEAEFSAARRAEFLPEFVRSSENCLTLENAQVAGEGGRKAEGYVYGVFERIVRAGWSGEISVRFSFESDAAREVSLVVEKQQVRDERFNGKAVRFEQSGEDVNFKTARVRAQKGSNVFEYRADFTDGARIRAVLFEEGIPESLRNCFSYSTYMEPVYVCGDFDVRAGKLVAKSEKTAGDLTPQGMENFCGWAEYRFTAEGEGRIRVCPEGDFSMCEISGGGNTARVLLREGALLSLPGGKTELTVRCYSTMRNRFGPFHCASGAEDAISPDCFTLRGGWEGEQPDGRYTPERRLVSFGLNKIAVEFER